jgi:fluoride exporter
VTLLLVGVGGAFGAMARYLLAVRLYRELGLDFPWGTLGVNVLGSLLLGVVLGLIEERDMFTPQTRSLITTGFLGGFTTFSTFVYEGWQYVRADDPTRALAYVGLSLIVSFAAFISGLNATKALA